MEGLINDDLRVARIIEESIRKNIFQTFYSNKYPIYFGYEEYSDWQMKGADFALINSEYTEKMFKIPLVIDGKVNKNALQIIKGDDIKGTILDIKAACHYSNCGITTFSIEEKYFNANMCKKTGWNNKKDNITDIYIFVWLILKKYKKNGIYQSVHWKKIKEKDIVAMTVQIVNVKELNELLEKDGYKKEVREEIYKQLEQELQSQNINKTVGLTCTYHNLLKDKCKDRRYDLGFYISPNLIECPYTFTVTQSYLNCCPSTITLIYNSGKLYLMANTELKKPLNIKKYEGINSIYSFVNEKAYNYLMGDKCIVIPNEENPEMVDFYSSKNSNKTTGVHINTIINENINPLCEEDWFSTNVESILNIEEKKYLFISFLSANLVSNNKPKYYKVQEEKYKQLLESIKNMDKSDYPHIVVDKNLATIKDYDIGIVKLINYNLIKKDVQKIREVANELYGDNRNSKIYYEINKNNILCIKENEKISVLFSAKYINEKCYKVIVFSNTLIHVSNGKAHPEYQPGNLKINLEGA